MKRTAKKLTMSVITGLLLSPLLLPSAFAAWDLPAGTVASNGLTWTRNNSTVGSPGKSTWSVAQSTCDNLTAGGFSDWRLPVNSELNALDKSKLKSAGWTIDYNWSKTPGIGTTDYHYMKDLGSGGYLMQVSNNGDNYVSCVR